jgi:hypothetical protein
LPLSCRPPRRSPPRSKSPALWWPTEFRPSPNELAEKDAGLHGVRTASLQGWNPRTRGIAITTRFGNVPQVHEVARPLASRRQVTFEPDTIAGASIRAARVT